MQKTQTQRKQQEALYTQVWDICCNFWGKMSADDYKDYVLGLLFYRYLSEHVEQTVETFFANDPDLSYAIAWEDDELKDMVANDILEELGYLIQPQHLFSHMVHLILEEKEGFDIEYLQNAVNELIESTQGRDSQWVFDGIFDDMDLTSSKLGRTVSARTSLITKAILAIHKIDFDHKDAEIDVLGDTYEYLIGQFAAGAGRKSGAFYTPAQAGKLLSRLATVGRTQIENAYDGCGGSASLLLHVGDRVRVANYYYQELTTNTYNLARMNMLLHNVGYEKMNMENDDTLENPAYMDTKMDVIVTNPPYSQRWGADDYYLEQDRFSDFGVIPPKSYADYAFLLSMFYMLKPDGSMAILLPHGVLFRGGREGEIRQKLIENNYIDAVIGLPENVFYGTSIPVICMVLRKNKETDDIFFVDASNDFVKEGNKNYMPDSAVDRIVEAYVARQEEEKYASVATLEDLQDNDYNLNIPRYVDTFEEEEPVDIPAAKASINELTLKAVDLEKEIEGMISQLHPTGGNRHE